MSVHRGVLIASLVIAVSLCRVSQALIVDVTASADAFVTSANPTGNFGGGGGQGVSAPGLPQGELQTLLRFDLAAAKAAYDAQYGVSNWFLMTAHLRLTAASPNNPIFNASAAGPVSAQWLQNDSWVEGSGTPAAPGATGVNWNTLPSFLSGADQPLGTLAFTGATSGTATFPLVLSTGLEADLTAGVLASVRLSAGAGASGVFNSRNFATATSRPMLLLFAAPLPEPAAGTLAAFGLMALVLKRRRRTAG